MYQDAVHMKMRVERDVPPNRRECVDGESLIVKLLIGKSLRRNKELVKFNRGFKSLRSSSEIDFTRSHFLCVPLARRS
jgi:hypothetical protein